MAQIVIITVLWRSYIFVNSKGYCGNDRVPFVIPVLAVLGMPL